jgi:glucosamine--fructose-6-phosphate aminotransferase (isomerizing)
LLTRGYAFESETDTEVLIHLIEDIQINEKVTLSEAVQIALNQVVGAYAIVVIDKNEPDTLIVARKGSPLVVGIGDGEFFVASDATPIVEYTREVVYLNDEEIAVIKRNDELKIRTIANIEKTPYVQTLEINLSALEKEGYEHFMLKEIYEQPRSIRDSMRGRLNVESGVVSLGGIIEYQQKMIAAKRIIIVACGTSWHAGLVGEYLFEELARVPVEVEYASEFRYRDPVIYEDDVVIAISQSGETADTLAAIELAKSKGATIIGICNVVGSSIARATHAGSYTHAGPEIGVASTKAFTAQVTLLTLMALMIADRKGTISKSRYHQIINELDAIPAKVKKTLEVSDKVMEIARLFKNSSNALYLGRGYNFPVAMEGALKLKEISYIHAEGYPAAEMKHGPIALIDEEMPVVVIATNKGTYEKVVSNIQEVKARKGKIIAIVTEGDQTVKALADHIIEVPETEEMLVPLIATIPLQLLAYQIAVMRGCNVDQPRNLAKSVTVE